MSRYRSTNYTWGIVLITIWSLLCDKISSSSGDVFQSKHNNNGQSDDVEVTTGIDTTGTMVPFQGAADINVPYWIAGTAFPW